MGISTNYDVQLKSLIVFSKDIRKPQSDIIGIHFIPLNFGCPVHKPPVISEIDADMINEFQSYTDPKQDIKSVICVIYPSKFIHIFIEIYGFTTAFDFRRKPYVKFRPDSGNETAFFAQFERHLKIDRNLQIIFLHTQSISEGIICKKFIIKSRNNGKPFPDISIIIQSDKESMKIQIRRD